MRKSISIMLGIMLLAGISVALSAQSTLEELDQVELTKQFTGKWTTQWSENTTGTWEVKPSGDGYDFTITWKTEGSPILTDHGIIGFSEDGVPTMAFMWSSRGLVTCDYGKFVSKNKMLVERYYTRDGEAEMVFEYEFLNPGKLKMIMKGREPGATWDKDEVREFIFEKY
jgi:hypothetical protein